VTVEAGAYTVTLTFPPGAVSEPVIVSFQPAISSPALSGLAFQGRAFACASGLLITPHGWSLTEDTSEVYLPGAELGGDDGES
jgi:hypothetical protein